MDKLQLNRYKSSLEKGTIYVFVLDALRPLCTCIIIMHIYRLQPDLVKTGLHSEVFEVVNHFTFQPNCFEVFGIFIYVLKYDVYKLVNMLQLNVV